MAGEPFRGRPFENDTRTGQRAQPGRRDPGDGAPPPVVPEHDRNFLPVKPFRAAAGFAQGLFFLDTLILSEYKPGEKLDDDQAGSEGLWLAMPGKRQPAAGSRDDLL